MGKTATNLSIVLGLITVAFAGYYIYTQNGDAAPSFSSNEQTMENMINNNRIFSERRQILEKIELNVGFFEDKRFKSLRSFTKQIQERPIGRSDPFSNAVVGTNNF